MINLGTEIYMVQERTFKTGSYILYSYKLSSYL